MNRMMRGSLIVFSLLIIGLIVSITGTISAKATKTEVTGQASLTQIIDLQFFNDEAGGLHIRNLVLAGNFSLTGDGINIEGTLIEEIIANLDETLSGPAHASFTVTIDGEETVIWEGHASGQAVGLSTSGKAVAQGSGPFAGMKLKFSFEETSFLIYSLEGHILDPHGN